MDGRLCPPLPGGFQRGDPFRSLGILEGSDWRSLGDRGEPWWQGWLGVMKGGWVSGGVLGVLGKFRDHGWCFWETFGFHCSPVPRWGVLGCIGELLETHSSGTATLPNL